ncbi:MAG: helix-turn-helix domain-containing protein [Acidobacteriota bacterium]|nr:helix-turn-helix domain-containing protein [Acidobacteriota bacterium]
MRLFQKQVAEEIGVDETSIYNWESNRVEPAVRFIPRLHLFLGYCPYSPDRSLSAKLKTWRKGLGLSQERMAKAVAVDEGTWRRWEAGGCLPAPKYVDRIKRFLEGSLWLKTQPRKTGDFQESFSLQIG